MKDLRETTAILALVEESCGYALRQLGSDRFRTLLSLLGISIGIFSIVTVLTLVDSLKDSITDSFNEFGSDVALMEQIPLEPDLNEDGIFRWWRYTSRPQVTLNEYEYLRANIASSTKVGFAAHLAHPVFHNGKKFSDGETIGVAGDWETVISEAIQRGRRFTDDELEKGEDVAIIGQNLADKLFNDEEPVGGLIRLGGKQFEIVGVLEKNGSNIVSLTDVDAVVVIPAVSAEKMDDLEKARCTIAVGEDAEDDGLLRLLMRQYRRIQPGKEDDFSINRLSFVAEQMSGVFRLTNSLGWIIGLFSLIVGGFGTANIMFVNVVERKREIGIQKALGAKRKDIVTQFLTEASILTVAGGLVGIVLTILIVAVIPKGLIEINLKLNNILIGIAVSAITGIISGLAPASAASKLKPVDAINS